VTGGCGNAISPSGKHVVFLTDAGHVGLRWHNWDGSATPNGGMDSKSLSCIGFSCSGMGGMDRNRWSCNSDKWLCLCVGWVPGGRFGKNGSNQVLYNWIDKKGICSSQSKSSSVQVDAGDFWVSSLDDVNENLKQYVAGRDTWIDYYNESGAVGTKQSSVSPFISGTVKVSYSKDSGLHIAADSRLAGARADIYSMQGKWLYSRSLDGSATHLPSASNAGSVLMIRIMRRGRTIYRQTCNTM